MARKNDILSIFAGTVEEIKEAGLFKGEAPIASAQGARVRLEDGREVINMCANNYLGLGDSPRLIEAAKRTYDERGYGMASVRFICGTQDIHKQLEEKISRFLGTDDTILYSSCFDANGGLFEILLGPEDAVISDELNHASIIDGVRLCKAKRLRYKNNDMEDLENRLKDADALGARIKLIATDGVFSMDGIICNLKGVCDLADRYNALVMVDDSHAVGFVGKHGRGTPEYNGVEGRVDIITGTLGKALGGASGGYTSGRKEIIDLLRQRSRPLPVLQHPGPGHCGGQPGAVRHAGGEHGAAGSAGGHHRLLPQTADRQRLRYHPRHPSLRSGDALRREAGRGIRPAHDGKGRLRGGLLLPGGSQGKSPHPHPGVRQPYPGRYRLHREVLY